MRHPDLAQAHIVSGAWFKFTAAPGAVHGAFFF
jgi:hypothetical protein